MEDTPHNFGACPEAINIFKFTGSKMSTTTTTENFKPPSFIPDKETRKMAKARKRSETNREKNSHPPKVPRPTSSASVTTMNKFDILSDMDDDDMSTTSTISQNKIPTPPTIKRPPPIHVYYTNYVDLKKQLQNINGITKDTTFKFLLNNLAVKSANLEEYMTIKDHLTKHKIQYYSYNPTPTKPRKALIKYLPSDMDTDDILTDLVYKGIPAIKVTNLLGREKTKTNMFIVHLSKNYIEKLYGITNITGFSVKIEALKPKNAITQCHRCQRLGHGSMNCQMQARCVKCGGDHLTSECSIKKTETSKCRCVNCGEAHPASYKGCSHYKEAMATRQRLKATKPNPTTENHTIPQNKATPPALNLKNFPTLKQNVGQAEKMRSTTAWVKNNAATPPKTTSTTTPSDIGSIAEILTLFKDFAPLLKEIAEVLKSINIKETLETVKELLQTVSGLFGNAK